MDEFGSSRVGEVGGWDDQIGRVGRACLLFGKEEKSVWMFCD